MLEKIDARHVAALRDEMFSKRERVATPFPWVKKQLERLRESNNREIFNFIEGLVRDHSYLDNAMRWRIESLAVIAYRLVSIRYHGLCPQITSEARIQFEKEMQSESALTSLCGNLCQHDPLFAHEISCPGGSTSRIKPFEAAGAFVYGLIDYQVNRMRRFAPSRIPVLA
jgi:hypothetical protein